MPPSTSACSPVGVASLAVDASQDDGAADVTCQLPSVKAQKSVLGFMRDSSYSRSGRVPASLEQVPVHLNNVNVYGPVSMSGDLMKESGQKGVGDQRRELILYGGKALVYYDNTKQKGFILLSDISTCMVDRLKPKRFCVFVPNREFRFTAKGDQAKSIVASWVACICSFLPASAGAANHHAAPPHSSAASPDRHYAAGMPAISGAPAAAAAVTPAAIPAVVLAGAGGILIGQNAPMAPALTVQAHPPLVRALPPPVVQRNAQPPPPAEPSSLEVIRRRMSSILPHVQQEEYEPDVEWDEA